MTARRRPAVRRAVVQLALLLVCRVCGQRLDQAAVDPVRGAVHPCWEYPPPTEKDDHR
jgi:hypothetical protein